MNAVIFAGPTIPAQDAGRILIAEYRGPAAQGDVYRAALERPAAIGIIDGYFEMQPAVWHKEILWAMREGIHVFGSASMGALRAAELCTFGMVGIGEIFEAFRDGTLEDDDEVALIHGGAESGYVACSDPMVNIRATLRKAERERIIDAGSAVAAMEFAKGLFYADRSYARLIEQFPELERLRSWIPANAVNRKREDAAAMLRAMRDFLARGPGPKRADFVFEESLWWDALRRNAGNRNLLPADWQVLGELERDPDEFQRALAGALGWWIVSREAEQDGEPVPAAALVECGERFCRAHGIAGAESLTRWLSENECEREEIDQILEAAALADRAEQAAGEELGVYLMRYLRWTREYASLLKRARTGGQ